MSGTSDIPRVPVDNVIPFPGKSVPKFGFKRVLRRKAARMEAAGQLNLFTPPGGGPAIGFGRERSAKVVRFPAGASPFEEALQLDERDQKMAADRYWKAITDGDSVADAYNNLGIIEYRRGSASRAFNCFTNALEADPRHFEAHYNVANLYFEAGDLRLAKTHYEFAAEIRPTDPKLFFNLALLHTLNEDFRAAIAALTNYRELAPHADDVPADELLGILRRSVVQPE
ncbi:MAG: tetratricopeptide repeat protein [Candidatus Latescibacterota bacterium]|jgi:tetratricopeptide (TPR) repeat protein